ncbi:response regulator transcription factor [Sphingomonas crocodyli]|uniref:Response regulator transcription factor n=1 Tax=Sphingomonas crocodyli TaxID=1979270 RepID=A0A437M075_9SPHN|nr:response regulator [Sphingomonas crocodyli]RVT90914.1 response regulator transcription factor [Sphingomonas crocodyli]
MSEAGTVHIVDDDPLIRDSIEELLLSIDQPARGYASALDFLETAPLDAPGCILVDVRLPRMGGLELQAKLASEGCTLPVILMTGHADIPMTVQAMKAGAVDFLTKPLREQDILQAIGTALSSNSERRSQSQEKARLTASYATLSSREREVMALISAGKRNRDIATALSLSEITIKIHRASAMRKMGARNTQELVRIDHELQKFLPAI